MDLHRVTPDPFANSKIDDEKVTGLSSDDFQLMRDGYLGLASPLVRTHFNRFGNGARKSDFEVFTYWNDIERLLELFASAGHPDAVELVQARKLARAAKNAGWEPANLN